MKLVISIIVSFLIFAVVISSISTIAVPKKTTKEIPRPIVLEIPLEPEILESYPIEPSEPRIPGGPKQVECGPVPTDGCEVTQNTTFVPGTYYLPNGIVINASNVILDCNGATIYGGRTGIGIAYNHTVIKNCNIMQYSLYGIEVFGLNSVFNDIMIINNNFTQNNVGIHAVTVENLFIWNNSFYEQFTALDIRGPYLFSVPITLDDHNLTIKDNDIVNTDFIGIALYSVYDTTIINNNISGNERGIRIGNYRSPPLMCPPSDNCPLYTIENNSFDNNRIYGIFFDGRPESVSLDSDTIIKNNTFTDHGGEPYMIITLQKSNSIEISQNKFFNNEMGSRVGVLSSNNVEIHDNSFLGYTGSGFYNWHGVYVSKSSQYPLTPSTNILIYNNTFMNHDQCGVFFRNNTNGINNRVFRNTFSNNFVGVCTEFYSDGNYIAENNIYNNQYGFHIYDDDAGNFYLNNIYSNYIHNAESNAPGELSHLGYGNYWGHSSPPCFIPGVDSNRPDLVDSYAYCEYVDKTSVIIQIPNWDWYLVSFNPYPEDTSVEAVLAPIEGHYDFVRYFVNGTGLQYEPGSPFNTLTDMYPWYGYWTKVSSIPDNDLLIVGDLVEDCHPLTLLAGVTPKHWIGYWLRDSKETASALSSIEGNYEYVRMYYDGVWKTYMPALPQFSDLDELEHGFGYLIKMTNEDTLDYICGCSTNISDPSGFDIGLPWDDTISYDKASLDRYCFEMGFEYALDWEGIDIPCSWQPHYKWLGGQWNRVFVNELCPYTNWVLCYSEC